MSDVAANRAKFDQLKTQVDAIADLLRDINRAFSLPATYQHSVNMVEIYARYGTTSEAKMWADVVKNETLKVAQEKAERDCEQHCSVIAMNLHAIRAILPDLAARASLELGEIAESIAP